MSAEEYKERVQALTKLRGYVKGRLTKLNKFVTNKEGTPEQINIRLLKLESIYEEYVKYHLELLTLIDDPSSLDADFEEIENVYYDLQVQNQQIVKQKSNNTSSENDSKPSKLIPVKLPDVKLKSFNGEYDQWIQFRNNFTSLIHKRTDLDGIQKFTYLQGVLEGEAARIIDKLTLSEEGYNLAWEAINERYDNNRLIVEHHISQLLNTKPVKTGTATELQLLVDTFNNRVGELKSLNQPVDQWNMILVCMLSSCLDPESKRAWEFEIGPKEFPTYDRIRKFLNERAQVLRNIPQIATNRNSTNTNTSKVNNKHDSSQKTSHSKSFVTNTTKSDSSNQNKNKNECVFCGSSNHFKLQCDKFLQCSSADRMSLVNKLELCVNCFKKGHGVDKCESRNCKLCDKKHNTLLHVFYDKSDSVEHPNTSSVNHASSDQQPELHFSSKNQVILSTAIVFMKDVYGCYQKCRVLLDSDPQSNFITTAFADQLGIQKIHVISHINGLDEMNTVIKFKVSAEIMSRFNNFSAFMDFLVVPRITKLLPSQMIQINDIIPSYVQLADPEFAIPGKIDALIGGELFLQCIKSGRIAVDDGQLILQNTEFGYVAGGKVTSRQTFVSLDVHQSESQDDLVKLVKQFWELDSVSTEQSMSSEETSCENHFTQTHYRLNSGRYGVRLPFRQNSSNALGNSLEMAKKRFAYLEAKLQKNGELKSQYVNFMREYLTLRHMSQVRSVNTAISNKDEASATQYVLPHHAVLKPSSTTTKLRVVFDASAKSSNGRALNDIIMVGPTIQDDLFSIVLRFRQHQFAITADIEKMYRMVDMHPEDRKFQRILWRESPEEELMLYELNTITYGTSSAPYLATRVLKQVAADESQNYPRASEAIRDFYMDDIMSGADTLEAATQLQTEMIAMLQAAGMKLRKFSSNSNVLLNLVPESDREMINSDNDSDGTIQSIKTLGLVWDPMDDNFRINIKPPNLLNKITKRTVLSQLAGVFDPLGIIGPVVVKAKIFLQQLWLMQLGWDDQLPLEFQQFWQDFYIQLNQIRDVCIQRCVIPPNTTAIELHGFCDASQAAYGAVIYIRCIDVNNVSHVSLLCSKSKVAPLKKITIPRMELCGALLLVRLVNRVVAGMTIQFQNVNLWCDSTVALSWIRTPPNQLKTFVGNRVSEIQDVTVPVTWRHIPTEINPADLISRGVMPADIGKSDLWWHGPTNLEIPDNDHQDPIAAPDDDDYNQELLPVNTLTMVSENSTIDVMERFSSFNRLVVVFAYVRRFIDNCRNKDATSRNKLNYITVNERRRAITLIIRLVQQQSFSSELRSLQKHNIVDSKSSLRSLNPFLDENQLIRVGGRLKNSRLPFSNKHQLILPKSGHVTDLIFRFYHQINLHCGSQSLLNQVRQLYWPVQGKMRAKFITRHCIKCFRVKPISCKQIMGSLPEDRVVPQPQGPFDICGVDFCGPFTTTTNARRTVKVKTYVAIFVCFGTKAVHFEIVGRLTTECFMAALTRFVFRRGKPTIIHSDNGTNFVGAVNEMRELQTFLKTSKTDISTRCSKDFIIWQFNPPGSPHFGGLWEAGVKSFKTHLRKVASNKVMTFEELLTLTAQIEGCLNSRPITPLSDDTTDLEALTPGHFLIGRPITAIPEQQEKVPVVNRLKHWRQISRMSQLIWKRWSSDYLSTLQQRTKWLKPQSNLKVGDMVLIRQEGLPCAKWLLGRISKVYSGTDGIIRVANVVTKNGTLVRVIHKLCLLPIDDEVLNLQDVNAGRNVHV